MYPQRRTGVDPEFGGYYGPSGESLERGVADAWAAPRWITAEGGFLIWSVVDGSPKPGRRLIRSGETLLEDFLDLGLADERALPGSVVRFARRWGVLNLCHHALPATHNSECWHRPPLRPAPRPGWLRAWREPIEGWRIYAGKARTLLLLAAKLDRGELGLLPPTPALQEEIGTSWAGDEDWVQFYSWPSLESLDDKRLASVDDAGRVLIDGQPVAKEHIEMRSDRPQRHRGKDLERRINADRNSVAAASNAWVRVAQVSPQLEWRDSKPLLHVGGGSLFGALGVQILLRLAHAESLALCGGCPKVILHGHRAPRLDRANYCDDCRAGGVAQRRAKRRYRESRRQMRLNS